MAENAATIPPVQTNSQIQMSAELKRLLEQMAAYPSDFLAEPALVSPEIKSLFVDGKAVGVVDLSKARTTIKPITKAGPNQGRKWVRVFVSFRIGDVQTDNLPLSASEVQRIINAGTSKVEILYSLSAPDTGNNGRQYDQFSLSKFVD